MSEKLRLVRQKIKSAKGLDVVLHTIVEQLSKLLDADACCLFLIDYAQDEYVLKAKYGLPSTAIGQIRFRLGEGLIGLISKRSEPLNLDDWQSLPEVASFSSDVMQGLHGFLGISIRYKCQPLGVLIFQRQAKQRFHEEQISWLITLTVQIATSIVAAQTNETLKDQKSIVLVGIPSSSGVGIGKAVVVYPRSNLRAVPDRAAKDIDAEIKSFKMALIETQEELQALSQRLAGRLSSEERELFSSYIQILASPSFYKEVVSLISKGKWAQWALCQVISQHVAEFEAISDPYLRERSADVEDLGRRVLFHLQSGARAVREYPKKTILVGEEVTAASLAEVPEGYLIGIVSVKGSTNSHVAILARALGVPAVMGVECMPITQIDFRTIIVDGYYGQVYLSPSSQICREFLTLSEEERELDKELSSLRDLPAETLDGYRLSLYVNTGLAGDIHRALSVGAEGVGLHRTEVPFMLRDRFPTEEEQRIIYRQLLKAFSPSSVVMRTLDVGGDKILPYLPIDEENPFLGWRGIRISLDQPNNFLTQVRALLRASEAFHNLHIMLPMISHVEQLDEAVALIQRAYQTVRETHPMVEFPKIGIMIEVPSAVYQITLLAERVDFISIGTNDLIQYLLAVDRNNGRVAKLYNCFHPAVLQALMQIVHACHQLKKKVSICGEMAGDPLAVILLMAIGFDILSVSASRLPRVKWVVRNFSMKKAELLLEQVLKMHSPRLIQQHLERALEAAGLGGLIRAGRS